MVTRNYRSSLWILRYARAFCYSELLMWNFIAASCFQLAIGYRSFEASSMGTTPLLSISIQRRLFTCASIVLLHISYLFSRCVSTFPWFPLLSSSTWPCGFVLARRGNVSVARFPSRSGNSQPWGWLMVVHWVLKVNYILNCQRAVERRRKAVRHFTSFWSLS